MIRKCEMVWPIVREVSFADFLRLGGLCCPVKRTDIPQPVRDSASWSNICGRDDDVTNAYTAKYTKIRSGCIGQLVDWPEVVTEGRTLEEYRAMLEDALLEMISAYRQQQKRLPAGRALLEQIPVEV